MNTQTLIQIITAISGSVVGLIVAHHFTAKRDRDNRQRELRVQYLIEAFRCLAGSCGRHLTAEIIQIVEKSMTDVQLFGTPDQIKMLQTWAKDMHADKSPDLDDFLSSLRDDLRHEIQLDKVTGSVFRIRVKKQM
jgi:hypothetical protein